MPKINQAILSSLHLPLPPLAEQHRIVSRVAETLAVAQELDRALGARETLRSVLNVASLGAMVSG